MQGKATPVERDFLALLPSFGVLPRERRTLRSLVRLHLSIVLLLYAVFISIAAVNGVIILDNGIGILQNPPFFAHMFATVLSIPLISVLLRRAERSLQKEPVNLRDSVRRTLKSTRLGVLVYSVTSLLGVFALAMAIVMSATSTVNIYDSASHTTTFIVYNTIRVYQYVVCYPTLISCGVCYPFLLFLALKRAGIEYRPFAVDGVGGLRKYLKAFDGPIFGVQCFTVAIALANYVGWGGFTPVSTAIAIAAPISIAILAGFLYLSFVSLVKARKASELQRLSDHQNELYKELITVPHPSGQKASEIAEELEASLRVSKMLNARINLYWVKYIFNITIAVLPHLLDKEVLSQFVSKILS